MREPARPVLDRVAAAAHREVRARAGRALGVGQRAEARRDAHDGHLDTSPLFLLLLTELNMRQVWIPLKL